MPNRLYITQGKAPLSTSARTQRYDTGMDTFNLVPVALSLIGILSGFVVLYGLFTANRMNIDQSCAMQFD